MRRLSTILRRIFLAEKSSSGCRSAVMRKVRGKHFALSFLLPVIVFAAFGLLGVRPAEAAGWYVDPAAAGANNGTSWTDAWTSPSSIVWGSSGVQAGDTVYLSGGTTSQTYTATSATPWPNAMLNVQASGASGSPITIATGALSPSPAGHSGTVIFDGAATYSPMIVTLGQNYVVLDGNNGSGVSNWVVQDGPNAVGGEEIMLSTGGTHTGNIIRYLTIHDVADAIYAIYPADFEISHCNIYNVWDDHLIRVIGNGATVLGNTKIHDCTLQNRSSSSNSNSGPDSIQGTYSIDVYNNVFSSVDLPTIGGQHPDHIQTNFHQVRIWNNTFLGAGNSVIFENWSGNGDATVDTFQFYNNVVMRAGWYGVYFWTGTATTAITNLLIANNTFVDCSNNYALYLNLSSATTTLTNAVIENNIFYNSGSGGAFQVFATTMSTAQCSEFTFDYNLFNAGASGNATVVCNWNPLTQVHGQSGVPGFVNYQQGTTTSNVALASTDTAARGNALNLTSIGMAFLDADIIGTARPSSGAWDIGAYEYTTGSPPPPPPPPSGAGDYLINGYTINGYAIGTGS